MTTRAGRGWAGDWQPRTRLAGRIQGILTRRSVTDTESATGTPDQDGAVTADATTVRVAVSWFDPDTGRPAEAVVTGPAGLLADDPRDWHRDTRGGHVPAALLAHPDWPPERAG